jgi:malonyl CoA-acyl carrier protein transacylase
MRAVGSCACQVPGGARRVVDLNQLGTHTKSLRQMTMPQIPVYSNVTGKAYTDVSEIRRRLVEQVVMPVRWQETVQNMLAGGTTHLFDLGPRATIKTMVRKIDLTAWKACVAVEV